MNNILKNKKLLVIISVVLILTIGIIIFLKLNIGTKKINTIYLPQSSEKKISDDFKNGKISADEYVLYNAYLIFDYDKLSKKYKSDTKNYTPNLVDLVDKYYNQLSDSTKNYISDKLSCSNIILGPEESDSSAYNDSNVIPISNKIAASGDVKTRLEKHAISKNRRILV